MERIVMKSTIIHAHGVCLIILLCIHRCHSVGCNGESKTLTKAVDIQSNVIHEYLSFLNCQPDNGDETWHFYVSKCMENRTCVGIHSGTPRSICTLLNSPQNEDIGIDDLWLIIDELKRFEGM